jgi:cob(I)alamin adenosyltransferase
MEGKWGIIQVYTGDGKGKTTAAVGQAVRAHSHGLKVFFVSFHKDPERYDYGEFRVLGQLGIKTASFAKTYPLFDKGVSKEEIRVECKKGLEFVRGLFKKRYDMIVLDEVNISLREGYLGEEDMMGLLNERPTSLHLILTGRGAPHFLIDRADLVTRMESVKHHYDKGAPSIRGIEY